MRIYTIIIITFLLLFYSQSSAQYKVMFSDNYPPYNFKNADGELVGFNIDLINTIKELYQIEIELNGDSWEKINTKLNNNEIDGIAGAHYPGTIDNSYIYTRSVINTEHSFIYNKNQTKTFSSEKLRIEKEPVVALWHNDVLIHYVLSINPSTRFLFANNYDQLIGALENEDVLCIIAPKVTAMYYVEQFGIEDIHVSPHKMLERNMGFKISNASPELATILNNGLEIIMANGEYQKIYEKWIEPYNEEYKDPGRYFKYILIAGLLASIIILILLVFNQFLHDRVRKKTKDLQQQLEINSVIMEELEQQKFKAIESDRMKSAFLANMSHEIRTPMNGILGFAELLKTQEFGREEQLQFIDIILQSGDRMLTTINNIIDISKIESGAENSKIEQIDIKQILTELHNFFKAEADSKGIELFFSDNLPESNHDFFTDGYKINSILTNIIKNAIKFTNEGSVSVNYTIDKNYADFIIADTGIGIPKDKQEAIFQEFVQADHSHSSGFEGSGLGLSITKGYVKLLNGVVRMESEPGKGTIFNLNIPNANSNLKNAQLEDNQSDEEMLLVKNLNIIIAEDDDTSFNYLTHALKEVSQKITRAKNGQEVIDLAKNTPDADLILMDVKMPVLNGIDATVYIRKFNTEIPIIAQTAYAQDNYKTKLSEAGCNGFIVKPIHKSELIKTISQCLSK